MAESAMPIRRIKPQLQPFIPWRAGASRHQRWYESMSRTTIRDGRPAMLMASISVLPNWGSFPAERGKCCAGACPQPTPRSRLTNFRFDNFADSGTESKDPNQGLSPAIQRWCKMPSQWSEVGRT